MFREGSSKLDIDATEARRAEMRRLGLPRDEPIADTGVPPPAPAHAHPAYCAIEITDSSLREGTGPISQSKAGQVFCGDALSHAPTNVGKAVAESIVVEFKNRQRAR